MKRTRTRTHRPVGALPKSSAPIRRRLLMAVVAFLLTAAFGMNVIVPTTMGHASYQVMEFSDSEHARPWAAAPRYTKQEEVCLTQAIYYEAANQSHIGKQAVALVILNRTAIKEYPRTVCGVVHQSLMVGSKRICQFSYHCMRYYPPNPELWAESKRIAQKSLKNVFDRDILILLGRAQYFHAVYVSPSWAREKLRVAKIGDHIFYRDREL